MKLLRNKFVIGILCIIAGILVSFAALPALQGTIQGDNTSAVRMKQAVQAGTKITADMVETVVVPESVVPGGIKTVSEATGKYANTELYAGDYLTATKVSATPTGQNALSAGTGKGKMVMSLTVQSLAAGVSGRLQPGDVVSVIAVPKNAANQTAGVDPSVPDQSNGAVIYPELQYVEMCMATASDGTDASVSSNLEKDEKNSLPATVSLYVTREQAMRLAELEQNSTIDLAFVARGQAASQYIPDVDRVLGGEVK